METVEQILLDELKRLRDIADRHKDDTEIGQLLAITERVVAVAEEIRKWYAMECGIEPALTNAATRELVRELEQRLGVEKVVVNPYEKKKVAVEGAAIVLVVTD